MLVLEDTSEIFGNPVRDDFGIAADEAGDQQEYGTRTGGDPYRLRTDATPFSERPFYVRVRQIG